MARRSLKPQLNQIRSWVRQGRTDAWIAHQLEVSSRDITAFKREHELVPPEEAAEAGPGGFEEVEVDLRAEDDALVAAALDAEPEPEEEPDPEPEEKPEDDDASSGDEDDGEERPRRRRGRRGGRGRRTGGRARQPGEPFEGTFDHGEEGYGLWLDAAVQDDAVYAEHWAGHRPITIVVEAEQIVIRRADEAGAPPAGDAEND